MHGDLLLGWSRRSLNNLGRLIEATAAHAAEFKRVRTDAQERSDAAVAVRDNECSTLKQTKAAAIAESGDAPAAPRHRHGKRSSPPGPTPRSRSESPATHETRRSRSRAI